MSRMKGKRTSKINIDLVTRSKYFIPQIKDNWSEEVSPQVNSWFDIQKINYEIVDDKQTLMNDAISSDSILRSQPIKLSPTKEQKHKLLAWMELYRIIYNQTVHYFRNNNLTSFMKIRPIIKNKFSNSIRVKIKQYSMPVHVIDNAIKDVCKSYKTSIALKNAGLIRYFRIRYKKITQPKKTLVIEHADFSKNDNTFYPKAMGKTIKSSEIINKQVIKHDTRLSYDLVKKTFILYVPRDRNIQNITSELNCCGIDPGNKTFLTIYNPEGKCIKIANRDESNKLYKLVKRKMVLEDLFKKYKTCKFKKAYLKNNKKIMDNAKELHYKSARYLCKTFKTIYLGKLSTQGIVQGKLSRLEKLYSYALSHDKFRSIITNKAEEFNRVLKIVDESYTTRTCGCCGNINNSVGSSRIFNCSKCMVEIDRDLNGARNILIKNE